MIGAGEGQKGREEEGREAAALRGAAATPSEETGSCGWPEACSQAEVDIWALFLQPALRVQPGVTVPNETLVMTRLTVKRPQPTSTSTTAQATVRAQPLSPQKS